MNDVAIRADGIGKEYKVGSRAEGYETLRDTIAHIAKTPVRLARRVFRRGNSNASNRETMWALKDVSFEVPRGQVLGVIGRNGAGKSTLLKVLSRITEPTEGVAKVHGRVGSLLEVGTGFHPELTGRENVFLNGAILGMRRVEIQSKFDEIIGFAEVDRHIDTPVKHYSSGMHLRLAFAVAAHLEPEILLVDEVLAVGDASFQKKCLGKMDKVASQGRTILFVSHNMGAVEGLCDRAIWLDGGRIRDSGDPAQVITNYLTAVTHGELATIGQGPVTLSRVALQGADGVATTVFAPGDDIEIVVHYQCERRIEKPQVWISVNGRYGGVFAANMILDGQCPDHIEGEGVLRCRFKGVPLLPQSYSVKIGIRDRSNEAVFEPNEVASFNVAGALADYGLHGDRADAVARNSVPLMLPYAWEFDDGTIREVHLGRRTDDQ